MSDVHHSDCAIYNAPALPVGPCNCGLEERLRAEIERLTASRCALSIENERLTAALREMVNDTWEDALGDKWLTSAAMTARRALEGK
jgi:hypothetical protein